MNPVQATRQGGHRALAALRVLVCVSPEQRCTRGSAAKVRPGVCAVLLSTASSVTNGSRCHSCCQSAPARTKEPTHARTQRSAGQCNWGGGKPSPIPPIVLAGALKRLCADHQDCLVGFVPLAGSRSPFPPPFRSPPIRRCATARWHVLSPRVCRPLWYRPGRAIEKLIASPTDTLHAVSFLLGRVLRWLGSARPVPSLSCPGPVRLTVSQWSHLACLVQCTAPGRRT